MKKILNLAVLIGLTALSANIALADGMVFDPVDYPAPPKNLPVAAAAKTKTVVDADPIASELPTKGNDNFQNALFQLDSAQVEIRNNLLEYKSKYTDVDNQYKLIKNERKVLGKQVKDIEKRIKGIDKTKANIRKNMI